ncbi:uncharacterized protein BDZ99DRAFT_559423 [Mytilinidion resinicola]|uniref:Uncharacterized protein n=1 Tax=Mytilinidion resinicola TaxID=574789 RepID=A0A6A6YS89_9PEZI|nr:uncharacterized protein BDZ99DRAFT_559423 [Mytilinidion resinicola]KAF2811418.1 hypothetical protein BDZ99DRAFT_559423 [Mytilinidion resinicola]
MANMPCGFPFSRRKPPASPIPPPRAKQARTLGRNIHTPTWPRPMAIFSRLHKLERDTSPEAKMSSSSCTVDGSTSTMSKSEMLAMLSALKGREDTTVNAADFVPLFRQRFEAIKPKKVNVSTDLVLANPSNYRPASPSPAPRPRRIRSRPLAIEWYSTPPTSPELSSASNEGSSSSSLCLENYIDNWKFAIPGGGFTSEDLTDAAAVQCGEKKDEHGDKKEDETEGDESEENDKMIALEASHADLKERLQALESELEEANDELKTQAEDLKEESKKAQLGLQLIGKQSQEINSLKQKLLDSEKETEEARDLFYQKDAQLSQKTKVEKMLRNHLALNKREVACFNTQQAEAYRNTLERNANLEQAYEILLRQVTAGLNNEELMHHFMIMEANHNSSRESHEVLRNDRDALAKELREINYINSPYEDNLNSTKGLLAQVKKELKECRTENAKLHRRVETLEEEKAHGRNQLERERERATALEKLLDKEECSLTEMLYGDVCFMVDHYIGLPEKVQKQVLDLYDVIVKSKETIQMLRQREEKALSHARSVTYDMDEKNQKIENLGKELANTKASLADAESREGDAKDEVMAFEMKELEGIRGHHNSLLEIVDKAIHYDDEFGCPMVREGHHNQLIANLTSELLDLRPRVEDYEEADMTASERIDCAEHQRDEAKKGQEKAWMQVMTLNEIATSARKHLEDERESFNNQLDVFQAQLDKKKAKEQRDRRRDIEEHLEDNKDFLDVLEEQARREDERVFDQHNNQAGRWNSFNKFSDFTATAFLAPHAQEARVDMMKELVDETRDPQVNPTFDTSEDEILEEARTKTKEEFATIIRRKKQEARWALDEASRNRVEAAEKAGTWPDYLVDPLPQSSNLVDTPMLDVLTPSSNEFRKGMSDEIEDRGQGEGEDMEVDPADEQAAIDRLWARR